MKLSVIIMKFYLSIELKWNSFIRSIAKNCDVHILSIEICYEFIRSTTHANKLIDKMKQTRVNSHSKVHGTVICFDLVLLRSLNDWCTMHFYRKTIPTMERPKWSINCFFSWLSIWCYSQHLRVNSYNKNHCIQHKILIQ